MRVTTIFGVCSCGHTLIFNQSMIQCPNCKREWRINLIDREESMYSLKEGDVALEIIEVCQ